MNIPNITVKTRDGDEYYIVGILPDGHDLDVIYTDDKNAIKNAVIEFEEDKHGVPCGCNDILVSSITEIPDAIRIEEEIRSKMKQV